MSKIAVIYARYSSDNQRHESIDAQIRACEQYAKDAGLIVFKTYIDEARSATNDDRPQFKQMLLDSKKHEFQFIIVHKMARFARNRYDSAIHKNELKKNRVQLLSVLEKLDGSPESIMMESIIEGMAEYYSVNLSREVMKGMKENALKCLHTGGKPPLGYDVDPVTKKYIINEDEAEIVRLIFKMYVNGFGYNAIIDKLNELDYTSKYGRTISKSSLSNLLDNEKYMGVYTFNISAPRNSLEIKHYSGSRKPEDQIIRVADGIPAIITKEDFEKVRLRKAANKKATATFKAKEVYLLSGLVTCGECGARMIGNTKNSGTRKIKHVTYRCGNRYSKHKCSNKEIRREYLEDFVLDQMMYKLFTPSNIRTFTTELQKMVKTQNPEVHAQLARLKKEKASLTTQQTNLVTAIKLGQALEILIPELNHIKEKLAQVEASVVQTQNTLSDAPHITEEMVTNLIANMKHFIKTNNIPEVKKFISCYIKELKIGMEDIHLVLQYPLQLSLQDTQKLHVVVNNTREELIQSYSNKNL